jgi:hypothetical protein
VNCVLSNPFYREKVILSHLIKERIAAITDRQIVMDQFLGVFQKSFRNSSITIMYDKPITKCSILISAVDKIEVEWIHQLRDLLRLSDQIDIIIDNNIDNVDDSEDDLCDVIMQKYSQYFPCSIILNIIDKEYKVVIVVPSLQAKIYIVNKLTEYCDKIYGDKDNEKINSKLTELIRYEIGDIEEQCNFELELRFNYQSPLPEIVTKPKCTRTMISGGEPQQIPVDLTRDEENDGKPFCSTKSGIVQCDDGDIYVITTGHHMSERCSPINQIYTFIDRMWPSALELSDVDDIVNWKGYGSTIDGGSIAPFVSDVAILKPNIDIRTIGKFTRSDIIEYSKTILASNVPIIPGAGTTIPIEKLKAELVYSGCRTNGKMEVVGSGSFCQIFDSKKIYERFYVAKHISSQLNEDLVDVYKIDGSKGTVPGDSGACVTTMDGKIHSFVIGTSTGEDQFRLLSPAHFVLEQIKSLIKKKNVEFVRSCTLYDIAVANLQGISRSVQQITSFRHFNRSVRDNNTIDGNDIDVTAQTSTASDIEDTKVDDDNDTLLP